MKLPLLIAVTLIAASLTVLALGVLSDSEIKRESEVALEGEESSRGIGRLRGSAADTLRELLDFRTGLPVPKGTRYRLRSGGVPDWKLVSPAGEIVLPRTMAPGGSRNGTCELETEGYGTRTVSWIGDGPIVVVPLRKLRVRVRHRGRGVACATVTIRYSTGAHPSLREALGGVAEVNAGTTDPAGDLEVVTLAAPAQAVSSDSSLGHATVLIPAACDKVTIEYSDAVTLRVRWNDAPASMIRRVVIHLDRPGSKSVRFKIPGAILRGCGAGGAVAGALDPGSYRIRVLLDTLVLMAAHEVMITENPTVFDIIPSRDALEQLATAQRCLLSVLVRGVREDAGATAVITALGRPQAIRTAVRLGETARIELPQELASLVIRASGYRDEWVSKAAVLGADLLTIRLEREPLDARILLLDPLPDKDLEGEIVEVGKNPQPHPLSFSRGRSTSVTLRDGVRRYSLKVGEFEWEQTLHVSGAEVHIQSQGGVEILRAADVVGPLSVLATCGDDPEHSRLVEFPDGLESVRIDLPAGNAEIAIVGSALQGCMSQTVEIPPFGVAKVHVSSARVVPSPRLRVITKNPASISPLRIQRIGADRMMLLPIEESGFVDPKGSLHPGRYRYEAGCVWGQVTLVAAREHRIGVVPGSLRFVSVADMEDGKVRGVSLESSGDWSSSSLVDVRPDCTVPLRAGGDAAIVWRSGRSRLAVWTVDPVDDEVSGRQLKTISLPRTEFDGRPFTGRVAMGLGITSSPGGAVLASCLSMPGERPPELRCAGGGLVVRYRARLASGMVLIGEFDPSAPPKTLTLCVSQ